jgi:tetratricopeptide repeat protein 8
VFVYVLQLYVFLAPQTLARQNFIVRPLGHRSALLRHRYNISHLAMGLGDKSMAYQTLRVVVALNDCHAEAHNNLGVLEFQRGSTDSAIVAYNTAQKASPSLYEAQYNGALTAFKAGELENAHEQVKRALAIFPQHSQSIELLQLIKGFFSLC